MSLVSEALRKARREAEGQGRPGRGARQRFFFSGPGHLDSRLGTGLVLGAVITFAAALAGGLVAWWAIGARQDTIPSRPAAVVEEIVRDQLVAEPAAKIAGADATVDLPELSTTEQSLVVDGDDDPVGRQADTAGDDAAVPERAVLEQPGGGAEPESASSTSATQPDGPREFVAVATIGDVSLTLGYLVYRTTDPFVQINGVDVRVGSIIEGFVVDEIARDRVVLHDSEGPIVIRVR